MVHAEEKLTLGEIHQERDKIATPALNFGMITLDDAVNAQMRLGTAGHTHGDFLAKEEIAMLAESFRAVDGVVVRQGNDGHAALLTAVVNRGRLVVRLLAEPGKARGVAHAGSSGVEM